MNSDYRYTFIRTGVSHNTYRGASERHMHPWWIRALYKYPLLVLLLLRTKIRISLTVLKDRTKGYLNLHYSLVFLSSFTRFFLEYRLMDGQVPSEGRVEVFHNEYWGSVCDDQWSLEDAEVVCKDLGYSGADLALVAAAYGVGSGPIWLDDVQCRGDEESLDQCDFDTIGSNDCLHEEDASVICTARGSLRLKHGTSSHDGILKIMGNSSSTLDSVCGDTWTAAAGEVACRQLGFSGYLNSSLSDPSNSANSGHDDNAPWKFLSGFRCNGNERRLEACPDAEWSPVDACYEKQDVILQCDPTAARLVDGSGPYEGRVEVFYGATWGTVCDDQWSLSEADVVCRQVGYELGAKEAPRNSYFGSADGPILLDDLYCNGQESSLFSCQHSGFANHNCNHRTDAGTICLSMFFSTIVCRQLYYASGQYAKILDPSEFPNSNGLIALSNVECDAHDGSLRECQYGAWGEQDCLHDQDVGIECYYYGAPARLPAFHATAN
eukprot:XP_011666667.1 PREDICTED: neurotrypsin-like [Strongylocentrotus purpuratus]